MQTDVDAMQTDADGMQTDVDAMQTDADAMHTDVDETFWKFWFLVIGDNHYRTFRNQVFSKFSWQKSFYASLIGNCVSGFVGTFVMMWAMLFWHLIVDNFLPGTFNIFNWIATYVLMCFGSVFLETLTIRIIYKEPIKRLFLPMMVGNVLSYIFIAVVMLTATNKDPDEASAKVFKYLPNKQQFILLDSSTLHIDTSTIRVSFDKNNKRLNDTKALGYNFLILFEQQPPDILEFDLEIPRKDDQTARSDTSKELNFIDFRDEYKVILEQRNPDTFLEWTSPINTDTLIFKRVN